MGGEVLAELFGWLVAIAQDHEGRDHLALDWVVRTGRGGLGNSRVAHQRRLDLGRRDAMACHVDDIVDASEQPDVAIGIGASTVAREIDGRAKLAPVGVDIALVVAPDRAQHRGPWALQCQVATAADCDLVALLVDDHGLHPWQRSNRRAGLRRREAWQGRQHGRARLGLPPRIDDRAAPAADVLVVPDPRLGIDRLADRAEQAQRRDVVLLDGCLAGLDQGANRGWCRVVDRDLVLVDDLPVALPRRVLGRALIDDARRVVCERAIDHVRMAGHPAAVGRAPEDVVALDIEDPLVRKHRAEEVAARGVDDALRLGGRAGGVEHEQHVFGVHHLGCAARLGCCHRVVPPGVVVMPGDVLLGALDDEHVLDAWAVGDGLVDDVFERDNRAASPGTVAGDDEATRCVLDAVGQRVG